MAATKKQLDNVLKDIKEGNFRPLYFLFGEEEQTINDAFEEIISLLIPEEDRALNLEIVKPENLNLSAAALSLLSYPLFPGHKIVALVDCDLRVFNDMTSNPLIESLAYPPPSQNHLIIKSKIGPDKRKKFFKIFAQSGECLEFSKITKQNSYLLEEKIRSYLEKAGSTISQDALLRLMDQCDYNLNIAISEIEKLILYTGSRKSIDRSDINEVVISTKKADIFSLLDAIGKKEEKAVFNSLEDLLSMGEKTSTLNFMLAKHLRLIIQAREFLDNISSRDFNSKTEYFPFKKNLYPLLFKEYKPKYEKDTYNLFSYHPFFIYKVLLGALNFDSEKLVMGLKTLHQVDIELKSLGIPEKTVIERAIFNLLRQI